MLNEARTKMKQIELERQKEDIKLSSFEEEHFNKCRWLYEIVIPHIELAAKNKEPFVEITIKRKGLHVNELESSLKSLKIALACDNFYYLNKGEFKVLYHFKDKDKNFYSERFY